MEKHLSTEAALVADRGRRMLAPTYDGLRGGAVSIDSFPGAADSVRARILMV